MRDTATTASERRASRIRAASSRLELERCGNVLLAHGFTGTAEAMMREIVRDETHHVPLGLRQHFENVAHHAHATLSASEEMAQLDIQRAIESKALMRASNAADDDGRWYAVDATWWQRWAAFLEGGPEQPGAVRNAALVAPRSSLLDGAGVGEAFPFARDRTVSAHIGEAVSSVSRRVSRVGTALTAPFRLGYEYGSSPRRSAPGAAAAAAEAAKLRGAPASRGARINTELRDGVDYRRCNAATWALVRQLYGGGPAVEIAAEDEPRLGAAIEQRGRTRRAGSVADRFAFAALDDSPERGGVSTPRGAEAAEREGGEGGSAVSNITQRLRRKLLLSTAWLARSAAGSGAADAAGGAAGDAAGTRGAGTQVSVLLCTVIFYANHAHNLTRSP